MQFFQNRRVKWPYATHLVDPSLVTGILPVVEETNPGSLVLARVVSIGKHRDLEERSGRRMSLFVGDIFVGVLGNRYATDQFEGVARISGPFGHIIGIGGVVGDVVSMNNRMPEPTVIEWLGRLAGPDGEPLHLTQFPRPLTGTAAHAARPVTVLSLGASMNSGKTTTAAQMVHSLANAGHVVAAAKITGTACRKDPNLFYDAGAVTVVDFTDAGWPSTADCSLTELTSIAAHLRGVLAEHRPEFVVIEIADGVVQRETAMLLADPAFRASIDAVTFAAPDALSCDAGVRRLRELGYTVLATAGPVANGRLGVAEAEAVSGVQCLEGVAILEGALVPAIRALAAARDAAPAPHGGIRPRPATIPAAAPAPLAAVRRATPPAAARFAQP